MISVLGSGAFGTALAISLSRDGQPVTLWSRNANTAEAMQRLRTSSEKCPGFALPDTLVVTSDLDLTGTDICLIAVPMQEFASFLENLPRTNAALIACCKGVDQSTGLGPVGTLEAKHPDSVNAILTGPSFAVDIASALPTALVLACSTASEGLQQALNRPTLRVYRTSDVIGAELGGALKNVIALAAGIAIGAGLGESARASVIARGFAEMSRFAAAKGAQPETRNGLAGLGDLVLTCTSEKSRNFSAGIALGSKKGADTSKTIEGLYTAQAVAKQARSLSLELPLLQTVASVIDGSLDIEASIETLMSRPVGTE